MTDEDRILQAELAADLHHVAGIAGQACVFGAVIGLKIRSAGSDVVEYYCHVVPFEGRRYEAPHVLVAAEPVREEHGAAGAANAHVVPFEDACHSDFLMNASIHT